MEREEEWFSSPKVMRWVLALSLMANIVLSGILALRWPVSVFSPAKRAARAHSPHITLDFQQQEGACYVVILDDRQIVAHGLMKWIDNSAFNGWYTSFEVRIAGGYATGVYFPVPPAQPFIQGYGGGDVVYPHYTGECPDG